MSWKTILALPLLAGGMLALAPGRCPGSDPIATRLVRAEIRVDGALVLEASSSDDGRPDADQVWLTLPTFRWRETEAFAQLGVEPAASEATIEREGSPTAIVVDQHHGGEAASARLRLVREPGGSWTLPAEEVDRLFATRRITRRQAALLKDPERLR